LRRRRRPSWRDAWAPLARPPRPIATSTASCHDVGCGTFVVRAATENPRATARIITRAPDAATAHPRSAAGHHARRAWTRQSGRAAHSPTGTATRLAMTPPSGNDGAKRARMRVHGIDAASVGCHCAPHSQPPPVRRKRAPPATRAPAARRTMSIGPRTGVRMRPEKQASCRPPRTLSYGRPAGHKQSSNVTIRMRVV
jgi:hypothetical protein